MTDIIVAAITIAIGVPLGALLGNACNRLIVRMRKRFKQ